MQSPLEDTDIQGNSPCNKAEKSFENKFLPPFPWGVSLNSSMSKCSDSALLPDKTIYNIEEQASRMDFDKYSIYEQINNVEIDDRSFNHSNLDMSSLTRIDGNDSQTPVNNTINNSGVVTELLDPRIYDTQLLKTKSVPSAKIDENENITPLKPPNYGAKTSNLNDSFSTTIQYLSPIQAPRTISQSASKAMTKKPISFNRSGSQVIETNRVDKSVDEEGQKKINHYILVKEIGR